MFCTKCGSSVAEMAVFCSACGQQVRTAANPLAPSAYSPVAAPPQPYAGFWLRFVAYLLDSLIVGSVFVLLAVLIVLTLGGMEFLRGLPGRLDANDPSVIGPLIAMYLLLIGFSLVGGWLYYAMMESSPKQGTLGKIAMGLTVTDLYARPITFGRATGRYFAKIVTGLIPLAIGFIMAGFTEKKQALHDMIASTLVLKKL